MEQVEKIVIHTSHHTHYVIGTGANDPQKMDPKASRETLDHSIMYIFAVALQDGRWHHVNSYAPRRAGRADTVKLWHKIETREDPEWDAALSLDRSGRAGLRRARRDPACAMAAVLVDEMAVANAHPLGAKPFGREDYIRKFQQHDRRGDLGARESNRFLEAAQSLPQLEGGRAAPAERGAACRSIGGGQAGDILNQHVLSREAGEGGAGIATHPAPPLYPPASRERVNHARSNTMSDTAALPNRAKKGVGLSGVTAGNTALCTVGRTGNDLHYRGYDILDVAEACEFEEIALSARARRAADTRPSWPATRRSCARCADCRRR